MKKSKSSESRDRLSELPYSLIFHIFWFLPIMDVVKTTLLSKRWKDLWKTVPYFNFDDCTLFYFNDYMRVRDFVNRTLILWGGIRILKFKINSKYKPMISFAIANDIDVWMRFAIDKEAQELELHLPDEDDEEDEAYMMPQCLYSSCSSLKSLSLRGVRLQINGKVEWDQLRSLTIHAGSGCLDQHAINEVLCGSPKLEVFVLSVTDFEGSLCIRSNSLKELSIERMDSDYGWRNTELKIRAPNVETLEISGQMHSRCSMNVSSVRDVTLGFFGCSYGDDGEMKEFQKETLRLIILLTIQHVESVTLSNWCVKMLGAMNKRGLLSPLYKVKFLKLNASFSKPEQVARLLEIFPKLKRLVIIQDKKEDDDYYYYYYEHDQDSLGFEANLPNSFLQQLSTVMITWEHGEDSIFPFIEIVLKYASKLEKMVFQVKGTTQLTHSLFLASQKLLKMPRSSPTAQLIFCDY